MACLLKAPDAVGKGCVTFTTPERDLLINKGPAVREAVVALKKRFLVGLHHNWHDHAFAYDSLFDFSMAGDEDLIERDGRAFARIPLDACNFAPACFAPRQQANEPFWDVLNVSRAVFFKGIPEFFQAIRAIYDRDRFIRVLYLCPVPPANKEGTVIYDIRQRYEAIFSPEERRFFTLLTMEWDYPFPLDLETLAFFYRSSRVYVHPSPEERRCRVASYAWASRVPVVSRGNVASIVPSALRRRPFYFGYDDPAQMADAIIAAIDSDAGDPEWSAVANEFRSDSSVLRLESHLIEVAHARNEPLSRQQINKLGLDIRLGRHHEISSGANAIKQDLDAFCAQLLRLSDAEIALSADAIDPEVALAFKDTRETAGNGEGKREPNIPTAHKSFRGYLKSLAGALKIRSGR